MPEIMGIASRRDTFATFTHPDNAFHPSATSDGRDKISHKILTNELGFRALGKKPDPAEALPAHQLSPKKIQKRQAPRLYRGSGKLPVMLIQTWANTIKAIYDDPPRTVYEGSAWARTLELKVPPAKRKRPLGTPTREVEISKQHRRRRTAREGVAAGRQFRRQAFTPILERELEPGEAADRTSKHPFPFDTATSLPPKLQEAIDYVFEHQDTIKEERAELIKYWTKRAIDLAPASIAFIRSLPESNQKILMRGTELGEFFHAMLFKELLEQIGYQDSEYPIPAE
jgi:hypothetical protein